MGLYGLFAACTDGVGKAWISGLVPAALQSSAQGIFQGATGFAVLSAGLWAGLLWGPAGRLPLLISGIAGGLFAALLLTSSIGAASRTKSPLRRTTEMSGIYAGQMAGDEHASSEAPGAVVPSFSDLTALPDLSHDRARAGPVRERRPVYVDLLPPCNAGCPAGENIQAWLAHAAAGRHEQAWRQLVADNPLAAIHGRVCYHPCENVCNRGHLDSSVSIHSVERFLGDLACERGWRFEAPAPTGKRVLVVGAGPSGLSAAYHLARLGHQVEVRDAGAAPGGMMRYGIPSYRLPREVLDAELDRIAAMGVVFTCGHRVEDLAAERDEGDFDAVFVAVGAHLAKRVDIPVRDAATMVDAVSFLRDVASGESPAIGKHVAVYGGGNTAMDAARVARRLGAQDAVIVYRRTRVQMPAHEQEAEDAEREGVRINWLRTVNAFDGPELRVEVMELDESGYPRPTGRFETLAADTLIMALGQVTESAFMRTLPGVQFDGDGSVRVTESMMTGCPGFSPAATWCPVSAPSQSVSDMGRGRPATSMPGCAATRACAPRNTPRRRSTLCTCGISGTPHGAGSPNSSRRHASRISARSSAA